jgi:hypothetical protein
MIALDGVMRGSAPSSWNCQVLSTVAVPAGGPARSSGEAPVMGVERRGRLIWDCSHEQPEVLREEAGGHARSGR